jgi:hypothetical protein
MNWWLVAAGLKYGMVTVQPDGTPAPLAAGLVLAGAALSPPGAPSTTPHPGNHPGDHLGATGGHTTEPSGSDQPTRRDTRSATAGKGAAGTRGHGPRLDKVGNDDPQLRHPHSGSGCGRHPRLARSLTAPLEQPAHETPGRAGPSRNILYRHTTRVFPGRSASITIPSLGRLVTAPRRGVSVQDRKHP